MSKDFRSSISKNINTNTSIKDKNNNLEVNHNMNNSKSNFVIEKKKEDKANKKVFNLYIHANKLKELDGVCKKTKYSRNELVNMMIDHCLENMIIEE